MFIVKMGEHNARLSAIKQEIQEFKAEINSFPANICWSWRRLEDVLKTCLEDVFNTSSA